MTEDLQGMVGIVTGAAQGLGYAIAKSYVQEGMKVALMDVRGDLLQQVCKELTQDGGDCIGIQADLSDVTATETAIKQALNHYGTPRVLVHNAAILNPRPLLEVTLQEWLLTVNVGIQAAFLFTKALWPLMTEAGQGSIVYVSSRSGIEGFADESAYCTAKHGLEGLMKSLAIEGQSCNIAVNTITPGMYMNTPMSEQNYPDKLKQKWVDPILLAPAFVHLAQQDASGTTGQRLDAWELSETIRQGS
jgi:NAD(P)-dependent dehydrogenase (short-subunit alcohol dehydrogenase family)